MGKTLFRAGALFVSLGVFGLLLWKASERSEPPVVPVAPVDAAVAPTPTPTPEAGAILRQLQGEMLGGNKNSFHLGASKADPHAARMFAEELQRSAKADGGTK